MRHKHFYDFAHAHAYLTHSIIRLENEPIYVTEVQQKPNGKIGIVYSYLHRIVEHHTTGLENKDLNMDPVPLGFVNVSFFSKPNVSYRTMRAPIRGWKVGLTSNNILVRPDPGNIMTLLTSGTMRDTILGKFPSLKTVLNRLEKGDNSIAFSREFAVTKNRELLYLLLDEPVGHVDENVHLNDDYVYLSQLLEKAL